MHYCPYLRWASSRPRREYGRRRRERTCAARTYFRGEDCACLQNASAGAQSPVGERSPRLGSTSPIRRRRRQYTHGAPGIAKDPGGAVCRSQARAASDARPPGRRWPAGWRTEPRACCRVGSCEACETHGTCDGAVGDCVRCTSPRGNVQLLGPQLREGRAQDVSAGWHDWGASLRLLPPEHVQCPVRGGEELGRR